jgi:hypothetical protein
MRYPMHHVYADDGSFTIEVGGVTFGPYGPGKCTSVHPGSTMRCKHGKGHVGCHSADAEIPADRKITKYVEAEFTFRWWDKENN